MRDIPLGMALVPVEVPKFSNCSGCFYDGHSLEETCPPCQYPSRKDGKSVIFKLVDYPAKEG